ncbi:type I secretion system permease/ATPase [Thalassobius sp. Cn5-15]|uniref:type I secretion system permease/ATPase n=1 Tax=Thalassobius sp. Cn5-15 TaxID=2917763 RepID=UPI001EF368EF|nr:type I secretion system permease/ATPase [Thalassobius sp. Cn5-15]MCG7494528.1 type I secretion system permease/ATPase [Thalassobius sp. Cn5-15]
MAAVSASKGQGRAELRAVRRENRRLFWAVALFSVFVNLLMLTGPLYMMQIYDRVLGSRSEATLLGLTLLITFLFLMMGLLDLARGRIMSRVGARFQARLDQRVFDAVIRKSALRPDQPPASGLRDLEAVQRFLAAPAFTALFDIPWTPLFLFGIMIFHPWLGYLAVGGGAILILITVANQIFSRSPQAEAQQATVNADRLATQLQTEAEAVQSLGMRDAAFRRWQVARDKALDQQVAASDTGNGFSVLTKTFRLFLQSAMLGLGAYLVLHGELSPGAMIAGSILMGRALAPIELLVNQWAVVQRATKGWSGLADLLGEVPAEVSRTSLPSPAAKLEVQNLTLVPPGAAQATLRMLNFRVEPGQACGVIGPSGAGKSSLARALTGVWRPAGGKIRLDGATLDQYDPTVLGQLIGYLPQRVELFDGTIAENIARLSPAPDAAKIVEAARRADAHEMILKLPEGYDTQVRASGGRLSGGQIQRIGLARALYADPVILVLDEPNSNLDNEGSAALNRAIKAQKQAGKAVLIMAHRPAAIQECDTLLMLDQGTVRAFGPKEEVLRNVVQNHQQIERSKGTGGVQ